MRDTMQSALQRPDLSVWERTYLPTTSSKIKALLNGKYGETSSASRLSEVGATGYHVTRLPGGETALIELSSSHPEVSWSSYRDTQKSSRPMRCPSYTLASTGQLEKPEPASEEILDESTLDAWRRILSIFDTTLGRMVFGSSPQILSWAVSTIRRTTN
uniref:Uncharacterized protein n=1 Tax=Siphoviridae sp. ctj495 TaxID=2823592 RepID=A0A8S5LE53_9CAUD|nr:MAG TPA: hypothetical protein [Siphoviridae sp. ctj495]